MEFLTGLFDTSDFPARWTCGRWSPGHGWLHILSDVAVWAAYFAIPLVLGYFAARRRDLPFRRVFLLFVAFILLCGTTHLMEAVIFWWPAYRLAGVLKLLTAVVSWVTVLALVRVAPAVLAMRTPEELEREVAARTDAERRLTEANAELERRVDERTADLGRAVVAVAEEKERLRTTLASIGDAVISTDRDGNVTYLNAVAESLTGWTNAEAAGVPLTRVFRIVNESTRQPVENPAMRALKEGVIVGLANHTVLISRDGTERPIDDSAAPIRCKDGELVGCVLVFRDISERHRAEAENREARRQIAATLESITDGFVRLDGEWRVAYVNAEAERLNQLPRSETLGKTVWELFPAVVGTRLEAEYRRCVAEQVTVEFENHYQPWDRWYSIKGYPTPGGGLTVYTRDITDRKRAAEDLRQSEARFRAGIEAVSSLVWTNNAQGMMTGEQVGWGKFTGQDREGYQGYGWSRAVHPDDAQPTIDAWNEAVAQKTTFVFEHRVRRGDGQWRLCSVRAVPVFDGQGDISEWVGVHTDITDQRRAEETLREREAFIQRILDASPGVVYVFDRVDGGTAYINEQVRLVLGVTPEAVVASGRQFMAERVHPDDLPALHEHIDRLSSLANGDVLATEYRMRHADGRWLWFLSRDTVFQRTPDGMPRQVLGVATDITDRKEAEGRLRASEELNRSLMDGSADCVKVLDTDGRLRHMNAPGVCQMEIDDFGPLCGQAWTGLWPAEVREDVERAVAAASGGGNYSFQAFCPTAKGTPRWWDVTVSPVRDAPDGPVVRLLSVSRDITERKRAEDELRRLAAELSEADRRKDEFLATLAHELRGPLAPIRNGLQVIRLAGSDGKVEQARTMMERQLSQLVRLVDDLLDVSRITQGKVELRRERVELKAVVAAAVETARPVIEQAGHELLVVLPDEPIFVDGDPTRLAQVVTNLLTNSAKYTHPGGHVRLAVGREDGMAVVSVKDDGIGIPPAMLEKVFQMFTQVDRTLEKTTGGLGIGLSLVKGLVEMHGGTIVARSDGEGKGSEFVVRLPVVTARPVAADQLNGRAEEVVRSVHRRVLVVDDNADAADSLGQLLEMLGNEVRTAYDGEAGVRAAGDFRPAVVLMDIGMPKLNGYEAARRIRAEPWGRNMVLVALTGWGQDDDRQKSTDAGFNFHLVKPVETAALMKLLADLPVAASGASR